MTTATVKPEKDLANVPTQKPAEKPKGPRGDLEAVMAENNILFDALKGWITKTGFLKGAETATKLDDFKDAEVRKLLNAKDGWSKELARVQKIVKEKIYVEHKFSDVEKLEFAHSLSRENINIAELEDRKRQVMSSLKAEIDEAQAKCNSLANKISSGSEMRETDCRVEFVPKERIKKYFRLDNGAFVKTAEMKNGDWQMSLPVEALKLDGEPPRYATMPK